MRFNSYEFLFAFLPITFAGFFLFGKWSRDAAAVWLSLSSLFFYAYGDRNALPLLSLSIVCNYWLSSKLNSTSQRTENRRKLLIYIAVGSNLVVLAIFKYPNFIIRTANYFLSGFRFTNLPEVNINLPVGISFFTFTQIAFLVDSYQRKVRERKFVHYALFVTYFPHLVAGPILHHSQMMPQFAHASTYRINFKRIALALVAFTIGLAKKVILADWIGQYSDLLFRNLSHGITPTLLNSWTGSLAYTFQIYFDFSGYSDMAVGLSLLFGVVLPINFNSPYKATNIIDFWRRWHITLSAFLRDYLYIPLGGNRYGDVRRYINLVITMLLGGLWHGANWTFVLWGAFHGALLSIDHGWRKLLTNSRNKPSRMPALLAWPITFFSVVFSWVLFRSGSLQQSGAIYRGMLGLNGIQLPVPMAGRFPVLQRFQFVAFKGIWNESIPVGMSASEGFLLIFLCLAICLFLPNTADLIGTDIVLDHGDSARRTPIFRRCALAFGLGFLFVITLLSLHHATRFIYFQF